MTQKHSMWSGEIWKKGGGREGRARREGKRSNSQVTLLTSHMLHTLVAPFSFS